MNAIKATFCNGAFIPDEPVDWPEGRRVVVAPADDLESAEMVDEEQPEDPESIARWLAEFEAIPPLEMTPEEEAQWQLARQAQKDLEKATFFERAETLRRIYE